MDGLAVDPSSGLVTWTPTRDQLEGNAVRIWISDGTRSHNHDYGIFVTESANHAPLFHDLTTRVASADVAFQLELSVIDPDGDPLTLALTEGPAGLSLTGTTLSWTPNIAQLGAHTVRLLASDDRGAETSGELTLQVIDYVDLPPLITSSPVVQADEGAVYSYALTVSDPEGAALTYSLDSAPPTMTIDATGIIAWTTNATDAGLYHVRVHVSDPVGNVAVQAYVLQVSETRNNDPVINSLAETQGQEGQTYRYVMDVSDGDNDNLFYSLDNGPAGLVLDNSGIMVWLPQATDAGAYPIALTVSDGRGGSAQQSWLLTVADAINLMPRFTTTPLTQTQADQVYEYAVGAEDADGDPVNLTLRTGPTGMNLVADQLTWSPTRDDTGPHEVALEAADGRGGMASQVYVLNVSSENQVPMFTSSPLTQAVEAHPYASLLSATDADGDSLSFALVSGPDGMSLLYQTLHWTPTADQVGSAAVVVSVSDSFGGADSQSFQVTVAANAVPLFRSDPLILATEAHAYASLLVANDGDGDSLSFALVSSPDGMSLVDDTLHWTPTADQIGSASVVVSVSDSLGGEDNQSFQITVGGNALPLFTTAPLTQVMLSREYSYIMDATDADGDIVGFWLSGAPGGMELEADGRTLTWLPDETDLGDFQITLTAFDGYGGETDQVFILTVLADNNSAPTFTSEPETLTSRGQTWNYSATALDPENDPVTFSLEQAPTGLSLNGSDLSWTPSEAGTELVTLIATDDRGAATRQTFAIQVQYQGNTAPSITTSPGLTAQAGLPYSYDADVVDPDGFPIYFSLAQARHADRPLSRPDHLDPGAEPIGQPHRSSQRQ